jgi:hypothetical protein
MPARPQRTFGCTKHRLASGQTGDRKHSIRAFEIILRTYANPDTAQHAILDIAGAPEPSLSARSTPTGSLRTRAPLFDEDLRTSPSHEVEDRGPGGFRT